ncbi:MAG: hypothetical protein IPM25_09455 [Chloracidobacterium sp.]|nr:hypothetical protein [Chloracidobacterium sp.]
MLKRTITKFLPLVIFAALFSIAGASCSVIESWHGRPPKIDRSRSRYSAPEEAGKLGSAEITESSGLAASKCREDLFWTHNDSGDGPYLFAIDPAGRHLGVWRVPNAENVDWEDIAAFKDADGQCFVYIGDIGNSAKEKRERLLIYRVREPEVLPASASTVRQSARETAAADVLEFRYPDGLHDAETLLVHPKTARIYVVTRHRTEPAGVYTFDGGFGNGVLTARRIGEVKVPAVPFGFLTGGDIANGGTRLVLSDYFAAYELTLPNDADNFDAIFLSEPVAIDIGKRKQGEGIAYSAGGRSILATSEGVQQPLQRILRIEQ